MKYFHRSLSVPHHKYHKYYKYHTYFIYDAYFIYHNYHNWHNRHNYPNTYNIADTSPITAMTKKRVVPKYPDRLSVQPSYSFYSIL